MIIKLTNGFYIEVDEMNYTLKRKYVTEDKEGKPKDVEKTIGYYSSLDGAIKRYITLNQIVLNSREAMELDEFVKSIERINNEALRQFKTMIGAYVDDGK